ncbi:MAG: symmetrical bis(5'-nucleosyl)-tetraphosphatase [Granulosicoccus sp.]
MTTYVIGDLQGCLTPLKHLLDHINFDPVSDKIWFVGDLVNRGSETLETLRYVKDLGDSAISVLGNHDLHLLAVHHNVRKPSAKDTLQTLLRAPDRQELCLWLSQRPLLHTDLELGYTLVHAGIHPHWSLKRAHKLADELHQVLSEEIEDFLWYMYGNSPARWSKDLSTRKRRRFSINAFTRMRYCHLDGSLDFEYSGPPHSANKSLYPWYALPDRKPLQTRVVFGHWSSHPGMSPDHVVPTDRGCVWGGALSAFAIETGENKCVSCN